MFQPVNTIGPHSPRANSTNQTAVQTDLAVESVDADHRYVLCGVSIASHKGTTPNVNVLVKVGSTVVARHPGLAPGEIFNVGGGGGVLHIGAPGDDVTITNDVPTSGSVQFNIYGFQVPKTATP